MQLDEVIDVRTVELVGDLAEQAARLKELFAGLHQRAPHLTSMLLFSVANGDSYCAMSIVTIFATFVPLASN